MIGKKVCKTLVLSLLLFLVLLISGCSKSGDSDLRFSIDDTWMYQCGQTETSPYIHVQAGDIADMASFVEGGEGYVWLRNSFLLPARLDGRSLSIFLGNIKVAARVWLNDEYLGSVGQFPPANVVKGNRSSIFKFPESAVNRNGLNTLKIQLYVNGTGGIQGHPFISTDEDVAFASTDYNHKNSTMGFAVASVLLMVSMAYLAIWFARRSTKQYLFYSLMNFFSTIYLSQFYVDELPFLSGVPALAFNKAVPAISAFITAYFATSFIRSYLQVKDSDNIFIARLSVLFVPSLVTLCINDQRIFTQALPYLYVFLALQIAFAVTGIVKACRLGGRKIVRLIHGFSPVLICIVVDFFVHGVFEMSEQPYYTIFGWQGVIILFLIDLAVSVRAVYGQLEVLNGQLERQVRERTRNLSDVNALLEKEQKRSHVDLEMAEQVQRAFFIPQQTVFPDWEIAIYYKALSGVSGDMYDIYTVDDAFSGISLFDVSGHGMAAGLVTMLSKNIISKQYYQGLTTKDDHTRMQDLSTVMYSVNDAIIKAKGVIENYMTGAVMRVTSTGEQCGCEIVNAGNPYAMLNHEGKITELRSEDSKMQIGMIGISGIDVSFPTIPFTMSSGDSFILFTDGLTESENKFGEQYGTSRLSRNFSDCTGLTAQEQMDYILQCHRLFMGTNKYDDDISFIIVRRK